MCLNCLLGEGMVLQTVPKRKEYQYYLFNDLLLWIRVNKELKGYLDLAFVTVESGQDGTFRFPDARSD